jgi:hypothetical protein
MAGCDPGLTPSDGAAEGRCLGAPGESPDYLRRLSCRADFDGLASRPASEAIPGARSVKTVIDRMDRDALYFQNSGRYPIHWEFASAHLSGRGRPLVPPLGQFNAREYYAPDRRFILGAITYYPGADAFAFEAAPYDTADADMIASALRIIAGAVYFGRELHFHPTSERLEREARGLPRGAHVLSTADLFKGVRYQPLNLTTGIGRLAFLTAAQLPTAYVGFRDIVVLDHVPNDISVTSGIVTAEFQTPLSHVNVLAQNRGIPNMALAGAHEDPRLRALAGRWVRLTVGTADFTVEEVTQAEADAWWERRRPAAVQVPALDLSVTDLRDAGRMLDPRLPLKDAIKTAIAAFGGKASHYGGMVRMGDVPAPKAFAIPVHFYDQFIRQNGFDRRIDELLASERFAADPAHRDERLAALRADMEKAPIDRVFAELLVAKLRAEYPGLRMRFRSSTNAEDLEGFTGAGLYTSNGGDLMKDDRSVLNAIRKVWASLWRFRAFEERVYRSIDHKKVGMAVLVHRAFTNERVTGVALTANPFDRTGLEPGFYINAQVGDVSVVLPPPGTTTEQVVYHFDMPGQPVVPLTRSNLAPSGRALLTPLELHSLGQVLARLREGFRSAYGPPPDRPTAWYALEVDFKVEGEGAGSAVSVKQARPAPPRNQLLGGGL